jgi:hypothetical protein
MEKGCSRLSSDLEIGTSHSLASRPPYYATLDEAQAQELGALLRTERYQGARAMAVTTFEKGVQAGLEQGLRQGQRTTLRKLLERRFGPLSPTAQERLESLGPERLEELTLAVLEAQSLQELGLED